MDVLVSLCPHCSHSCVTGAQERAAERQAAATGDVRAPVAMVAVRAGVNKQQSVRSRGFALRGWLCMSVNAFERQQLTYLQRLFGCQYVPLCW